MRIILTISILLSAVLMEAQKRHTHSPAIFQKYNFSQMLVDSSRKYGHDKLRNNVITYVLRDDSCTICHLWYQTRINKDTFSTVKPAKYSLVVREQEAKEKKKKEGTFKKPDKH